MSDESPQAEPTDLDPEVLKALQSLPPEFSEFPRVYQEEIRPALLAREGDRQAAVAKARQARYVGIGIAVVGALLGFFAFRQPIVAVVAVVVGVGYLIWGTRDVTKLGREAKDLIVQPIARQLQLGFVALPGSVETIYQHHELGLVPSWDRASYEDLLTGTRHGVEFELFEAHLEEKHTSRDSKGRTQTRWVTVFRGQCIRFEFPKRFYGRTLVTRDAGIFNRFGGGKGLQRAGLEDPRFEKIFEVYTSDQVESRYLLTPDLMQKLVDLEDAFHGGKLKCCFSEGQMFITLEGGNLFEPGSMFKPFDSIDRVKELLTDFAAMFHIIDAVLAGRQREAAERGS